ncbi:hypothetical protein KKHFBJBL_02526 [Brevundimonas sp. NIBR11]|nr:hypothetical protein KKHFBJBL_02526 [Brevundimonas sp. NIBR11]
MVFLVAITALASLTAEAASARARVRFLQSALSQEAMVAYMLATEPLNGSGVAAGSPRAAPGFERTETVLSSPMSGDEAALVYLDGRPYRVDGDVNSEIELRDQAGMINLAGLDLVQMERLAAMLGIPATKIRDLPAIQADYIDVDDLRQPSGAERQEYAGDIANRPLLRPAEWLSLLGVRREVDMARWRQLRTDIAVDHTLPTVNVNTASSPTLQVLFGLSPQQADSAIRTRQAAPFVSLMDFTAAAGVPAPMDDRIYTFPSGRVILSVRDNRSAWLYRARLTLSPNDLEKPVWIDQSELTEAPRRAAANITNATRLPYTAH